MRLARDEMHVLTGSYALDALGRQESEAFERHLPHCGSCEAEVRGLRETAARLALARAHRPPARLERRVLAASYLTRQLPPPPRRPARGRLRGRPRGRLWVPRPALALAAVGVAATLALGVTRLTTGHQPASSAVGQVVGAPDARIQTMRTSADGVVTLIDSPSRRDAVLTAARLPSLPGRRVYQVWVIGPAGARSAGFLSGTALVLTGVRAGERVGVTVEPAGGTSQPTTTPIVLMPVPA